MLIQLPSIIQNEIAYSLPPPGVPSFYYSEFFYNIRHQEHMRQMGGGYILRMNII